MGLYRQLANIERILESEKRMEAGAPTVAHGLATNARIAARELVRAAKGRYATYGNADCALHAKSLADNLSLYLQQHATTGRVDLKKLRMNTQGLTTPDGMPVADLFEQTHAVDGTIAKVRHRRAHGNYADIDEGMPESQNDGSWKHRVAEAYLRMAEECLLAVHERPKPSFLSGLRAYGNLNGSKLATAGALLGAFGVASLIGVSTMEVKRGARERALRNDLFLAYADNAGEVAVRTQQEHADMFKVGVRMGQGTVVASQRYVDEHFLMFKCVHTSDDFKSWLDKVKYSAYAKHECLEYWAPREGTRDYVRRW